MKKQILVAALMGCMAVQGFAQIDKIVFVHEPFTISSTEDATGGAEYRWRKNGKIFSEPGAATYSGSEPAAGTFTFIREARKDALCDEWMPSNPFTVAVVEGANQLQGSCTFTQPPVVNTFANFPADYSASTFVTLTDERDGNNYTVVKMPDGKWWMAQNLNYQKGLVWNQYSNEANGSAFTTTTNGVPAIGSFWCPAGVNGATTTVSSANRAGCAVYGAFYTWETAMMVDGKWSDESRTSSTWQNPSTYNTSTTTGNTNNYARGATKRGICPPNWHVPTDAEWGDMLTSASGLGTDFNNGLNAWLGTAGNAEESGMRLKAACDCNPDTETHTCIDDEQNNWSFYNASIPYRGTDVYGFHVLPAGRRINNGARFTERGTTCWLWSSSTGGSASARVREFSYRRTGVSRSGPSRSEGHSIRCVLDTVE
jgi:uncharacterized protein (TIGR02145 family)